MAAGLTPIYVLVPTSVVVNFATANTGRDGAGTIATLATAGSAGSFFRRIRVQAAVTTTAGVIRIFKKASGGTFRLMKEILVTAITPSTAVAAWEAEWAPEDGITLTASDVLGVSTHNAETFNAWPEGGGDY